MPKPFPSGLLTDSLVPGRGQNPGTPGPIGGPGPGFAAGGDLSGTSVEQSVVGFRTRPLSISEPTLGQAYVFDGLQWTPGSVGANISPLSRTLFVDAATAVPVPDQNGSVSHPYSEIAAAADFINGSASGTSWLILVGPGTYSSVTLIGYHNVTIRGSSPDTCVISGGYLPPLTVEPPPFFDFDTVYVQVQGMKLEGGSIFTDTAGYPFPPVYIVDDSVIEGIFDSSSAVVRLRRSVIGFVFANGETVIQDSEVTGSINVGPSPVRIENCRLLGGISSGGETTIVRTSFLFGSPPTYTGTLVNLDGPTVMNFAIADGTLAGDQNGCVDVPDYRVTQVTTNATPASFHLSRLPVGSSFTLDVLATARETGGANDDTATYRLIATFKNTSGTPVQVGSTSVLHSVEQDPTWNLDFDFGPDEVLARLTGDASNTVNWTILSRQVSSPFEI